VTGKALVSWDQVKAPKKPDGPKERFDKLRNEPLRGFVRGQPCILAGVVDRYGKKHVCKGPVVCCHLKTKGSKGGDDGNTFPGCDGIEGCHAQQEGRTKQFEYRWVHPKGGLSQKLKALCRKITAAFYRDYPRTLARA
jgi:hypothetical protein